MTSAQLLDAGLTAKAVRHRLATRWLVRVHRGVFLVGPLEAPLARATAAVLAVGDGAVLSHVTAAALWELRPPATGAIDVTVAGRNVRSRAGIRIHRVSHLHPGDVTRHRNLPITAPARTLLDLATTSTPRDLARITETAEIQRRVTPHSLTEQFQRYPAHRGTAALREAIPAHPSLTRSEAERRMLELIRDARLPAPRTNTKIGAHEVDFLWPAERLVVEVDGFAFHSTRAAFERDRLRDADLLAAGYRVIRITWRQLTDEPASVVATLAGALAVRSSP